MLRDLLDVAILEDFLNGFARGCGHSAAAFDSEGHRITASPAQSLYARLTGSDFAALPRRLDLTPLPADEPPAGVAFVPHAHAWHVVAPVYLGEHAAGYVSVGEFRDPSDAAPAPDGRAATIPYEQWLDAWRALPVLERAGDAAAVRNARWLARSLAHWCRREAQLDSASAEIALVGDIGTLLSGEYDLQKVLDHIVAETARVMRCPYASLRLYDEKSDELLIAAVYNLSHKYRHEPRIQRSRNPIDSEALRGRTVYIENAQSDPRFPYRADAARMGLVSGLTTGMLYHGKPVGVLRIYSDRRQRFRASQRHLLGAVAAQAAIAIVNAQLLEQRLRSAALERQLAMAGQVQARMVRSAPPQHPHVQAGVVFEPSSHVGGDFCDVLALSDGTLLAAVGDVTGHGLPAALLMASVRGALRAMIDPGVPLAEILRRLNEHMYRDTSSAEFVSLLLARIEPGGRALTCCNAGHEALLLIREGKVIERDHAGIVLGVDPQARYEQYEQPLRPDDFVVLYTDGVIEAMNFRGEHFGRRRLRDALRQYAALPAEQAIRTVRWDVRRFVGLAEQSDDLTMVGLRIL